MPAHCSSKALSLTLCKGGIVRIETNFYKTLIEASILTLIIVSVRILSLNQESIGYYSTRLKMFILFNMKKVDM